jgi:PAS domain S-box-containing protein
VSFAHVTSVIVALVATLTLVGWLLDLPTLKSLSLGLVTMKPNTACSLLLAACSLFVQSGPHGRSSWFARLCALGPIFLGLSTLLEHGFSIDLGIDDWWPRLRSRAEPMRMSRATASCLVLSGAALLCLSVPQLRAAGRAGAGSVVAIASTIGLGYAFQVAELSDSGFFQPMALHTSLSLALLAAAMLSTPQLAPAHSYRDWPLRAKMIALLLATAFIPFLLYALLEVRESAQQILDEQTALLTARADQLADEIDTFQIERRKHAAQLAAAAAAVDCCDSPANSRSETLDALVTGIISTNSELAAAALIAPDGTLRASAGASAPQVDPQLVHDAVRLRSAVSSALYVPRMGDPDKPLFAYAAPVLRDDELKGVAVLWVSAAELWALMRTRNGLAGRGSFAALLDEHGIRIAHTYAQQLVFRPSGVLPAEVVASAVSSRRFGPNTAALLGDVRAFPEQFAMARSNEPERGLFSGRAPATGRKVFGIARRLAAMPWTLFYVVPEASVHEQLAPHVRNRSWTAAFFAFSALLVGWIFAHSIVRRVQRLTDATALIESESMSVRVLVESDDELGRLAARFNEMAERIKVQAGSLREANEDLEARVYERTAQLSEREQDLATTLNSIGDAVIVTDKHGLIQRMNPRAEHLIGWSFSEAFRQPLERVFVITHEQTDRPAESPVTRALREGIGGGLVHHTLHAPRRGQVFPVAESAAPIFSEPGELRGVVIVFRDFRVERQAQLALQDSERRYRELYEQQPDMCATIDHASECVVECNQTMSQRLGYTREELIGKNIRELYCESAIAAGETSRAAFVRTLSDQERRLRCKDGSVLETSLSMNLTEDAGRTLVAAVWRDISARKQAERDQQFVLDLNELQHSGADALLQGVCARLCEYLTAARVCWLSIDVTAARVNVACEYANAPPWLLGGHPLSVLDARAQTEQRAGRVCRLEAFAPDRAVRAALLVPVFRERAWVASLLVCHTHPHVWQEREIMLVRTSADRAWMSAEHTRMHEELQRREKLELTRRNDQRFEALVNSVTDYAIFQLDSAGCVKTWNRGAQRIKGYAEHEVLGQHIAMFAAGAERAQVDASLERARTEGRFEEENWRVRKDGTRFWANVVITPLFDANGQLEGYAKVTRDHSERRRSDEALQQRQLQLSASLRERDVLMQEIHHRVKNNLQVISSMLNMQMRHVNEPQTRSALEESRRRVEAIALIHEQLYRSLDFTSVKFSDYVSMLAANVFHATDVSSANVQLELQVEPVSLAVDKAIPFGLVINELITNTLKHGFPDQRRGVVKVEVRYCDQQNVLLVVTDDGIGIPASLDLNKTRSLGMQLVSTLVKQLRGKLDVVRAPGTTFRIQVPVEVPS